MSIHPHTPDAPVDARLPPPAAVAEIADRTGVSYRVLQDVVLRRREAATYRAFRVPKRSGGDRVVHTVADDLLRVQRYLNGHALQSGSVVPHAAAHAFVRHGGTRSCAQRHCGARWLFRFDIEDFFFRIDELAVREVFEELRYRPADAFWLSRLCTTTRLPEPQRTRYCRGPVIGRDPDGTPDARRSRGALGVLPQGAATSPTLSNLVCRSLDRRMTSVAGCRGMVYTRYADDMVLSCTHELDRRTDLPKIQRAVRRAVAAEGFSLNERKTWTSSPGARKVVLGLLVDGPSPRLTRRTRERIDRLLYACEAHGVADAAFHESFRTASGFLRHLSGLVAYAADVDPERAVGYSQRLQAVCPAGPPMAA